MYGKIFEQIFDSSIAEDWQVRLVFQDFIVLADMNGVVDRTPEAISRRTNVPLDIVKKAIQSLENPDPTSRSPDESGARIRRLDSHRDWGWEIINYVKYRDTASEQQRREKTKLRTRKWRDSKDKQSCDAPVTHGNAVVTPGNASDAMQKQMEKHKHKENTHTEGMGNGVGKVLELQRLVGSMMHRKENQRWSYEDESRLAEIARRSECLEEFKELEAFKKKMKEPKYFPQSVCKLLENWDATLDRSRRPPDFSEWEQKAMDKMIPKIPDYADDD